MGFCLTYPAPGIIENIHQDWDWIWIDGQHGQFDERTLMECIRTADAWGLASVVRIAGMDLQMIGKVLDMGASGIMIPMVETVEQAEAIVQEAHYPPFGRRSFGGRRVCDIYGSGYYELSRKAVLIVAQIENQAGLEQADAIAGVEGVDVLFYGAADMRLSLGLALDTPTSDPEVIGAFRRIVAAAKRHHKCTGSVALSADEVELAFETGCRFIAGFVDEAALRTRSSEHAVSFRRILGGSGTRSRTAPSPFTAAT